MPALPSRPSTTIARRCAASCTDRTCTGSLGFHALSLSKLRAATPDPYRAAAHSVCSCHPAGVCYRRVSLIPMRPGEGRLTEPTAVTQPWRRELVFMPHSGPCRSKPRGPNFHSDLGELLGPAARAFRSTIELQRAGSQEHPIGIDATAVHPFGTTLFSGWTPTGSVAFAGLAGRSDDVHQT